MKQMMQLHRRYQPRRGMTLFVVLVILSISMLILGRAASSIVQERQQSQLRHTQRQSRLITKAALDRGAAQLAVDENYTGETWTISASEVSFAHDWKVKITVSVSGNESATLRATATYPASGTPQVTKTSERTLPFP